MLKDNYITIEDNSVVTFTDASWNDCIDTGRSTGASLTMIQGGAVDYGSHLPVHIAMSSGESEYIAAAVACMTVSQLRMMGYNFENMGKEDYKPMNMKYPPANIIIDNGAAKAMSKCNKDTPGNTHVARRYHYVRQGALLNEHRFQWVGTDFQLADPLTKCGGKSKFKDILDIIMTET